MLDELSEVTRQLDTDWNTPGQSVCGFLALIARYTSLLQAAPEVFHLTDHYRDYPMILIDLAEVRSLEAAADAVQPPAPN